MSVTLSLQPQPQFNDPDDASKRESENQSSIADVVRAAAMTLL